MNDVELVFNALTDGSSPLRARHNKLPPKGDPAYILPTAVINKLAGSDQTDLRGRDGYRWRVIRIDVWGTTRKGADDYMELVKSKMEATGTFSSGTPEESGAPPYDDESNLYRASVDFPISFAAT